MKKLLLTIPILFMLSCTQNITYSEIELSPATKNTSVEDNIVELEEGETVQYNGSVEFSDGNFTTDVIWASDNNNVVTVENNGKITALKAGDATLSIIADKDKSKKAYLKVKVTPYIERKIEVNSGTEGKLTNNQNNIIPSSNPKPINTPLPSITSIPQLINIPTSLVSGKVFDVHGAPVNDAIVNIVSLDKNIKWSSLPQKTIGGDYLFKDVPSNSLIRIDVTKEGYSKISRTEVVKSSNLTSLNVFNFGGSETNDEQFAIQDEPQITSIVINSQKVNLLGSDSKSLSLDIPPTVSDIPDVKVTGTTSAYIYMTFSKEIDIESLENSFQIISQSFSDSDFYTVSKNSSIPDIRFSWSSINTQVSISVPLKNISSTNNIIYRLQFKEPFSDKSGKNSVKNKYIKLGTNFSDYVVFSLNR